MRASVGPRFRLHLALDAPLPPAAHATAAAPLDRAAALLAPFAPRLVAHAQALHPADDKRRALLAVEALSRLRSADAMQRGDAAEAAHELPARLAAASIEPTPSYVAASARGTAAAAAPSTPRTSRAAHLASGTPATPASPRGAERSGPVARWEHTGSFGGAAAKGDGEWDAAKTDEVAFGTVHIFRVDAGLAAPEARTTVITDDSEEDAGTILAVLAVPSHIHAADWLAFVEGAVEAFEHVRIIRCA
jgi:hypothetical protein